MTCVELQGICSLLISIADQLNPWMPGFESNNETKLAETHERGEKGAEIKVEKKTERNENKGEKSRLLEALQR